VPGVGHADAHAAVLGLDGHGEAALEAGRLALHGLDGVHHEVEERLVELDGVGQDERRRPGGLEARLDAGVAKPRAREVEDLGRDPRRIDGLRGRGLLPDEAVGAQDDLAGAAGVPGDGLERLPDSAMLRASRKRRAASAFATMAARGWFTSWASEAPSAATVRTREACATVSRRSRSRSRARCSSVTSDWVPTWWVTLPDSSRMGAMRRKFQNGVPSLR